MSGDPSNVGETVILADWDYTGSTPAHPTEGTILDVREDGTWLVLFERPVDIAGRTYKRAVIVPRHVGYSLRHVFPGRLRRLLLSIPLLQHLSAPVVAANIFSEDEEFVATALVYLKSVYVKSGKG